MTGKETRQPIKGLKAKVALLPAHAGFESLNALFNAICGAEATGKLKVREFNRQVNDEKMNSTYQRALGEFCGFGWPASAFQTGTVEQFENLLGAMAERRTDIPLRSTRSTDPWSRDNALGYLELFGGQWAAGELTPILATLICRPGPMGRIDVAVRRGLLEFTFPELLDVKGRASNEALPSFKLDDKAVSVASDKGQVRLEMRSTGRTASWDVRAEVEYIGKPELPDNLCGAERLAAGDRVKACFRVYIKDLEPQEDDDRDDETAGGPSRSFAPVDGEKMGRHIRNLILKRLAEVEQFGSDVSWVDLCRDQIDFEPLQAGSDENDG